MPFLHVSTTRKIIEKLARINEVSSRAVQPIPWKCEVFLWEQAFNFVPEDRETEQIGLRLEVDFGGGATGLKEAWDAETLYMHACVVQQISLLPSSTHCGERNVKKCRLKQTHNTPPPHPRPIVKDELRDGNQWLN